MARSYQEFIERKRHEHGEGFDDSSLAPQFIPFYENQQRIKVQTPYGGTITGTVGVTTGWRPSFLLMRRSNAIGSSDLLDARYQIVAVKRGRVYA